MDNFELPDTDEADTPHPSTDRKRGGWATFPFITGTLAGLTLASDGWLNNLIVYLTEEFNFKSIHAAQITNAVLGCTFMFPVIGAIVADSFLGCFSVVWISSLLSFLGVLLLTLTATFPSLRPPPCESNSCISPSKIQITLLCTSLLLSSLGLGGTRFNIATMGANQFESNRKHQAMFFNWYFFTMYTSSAISTTAIVYVEDSVSWGLGFSLCAVANIIGLVFFLLGTQFYYHIKPQGSPFTELARVVVATIRKRKVKSGSYYYNQKNICNIEGSPMPTKFFRFLNHAALKTEGDVKPDGSIAKSWNLCTVQQVEDLKTLIKMFPLWSTGIFLSTPIGIILSLSTLQALTMDRHLGPHFKIPVGSMMVFVLIATTITLPIIDRFLCPIWKKLTHQIPTSLQRIGLGHIINVLSMVVAAKVESERLKIFRSNNFQDQNVVTTVSMSVWWLVPQLTVVGMGKAFHFPGQVEFNYQEFPTSLKSTSTAVVIMVIGVSFLLSTAVIDFIRKVTEWLPDNINDGRLDKVYWLMVVITVSNFGYYLLSTYFYKYQNVESKVANKVEEGSPLNDVDLE